MKITDPKGLPLDRAGIETPGAVSGSLILAYIPKGQTQYTAYTTRSATSPITNRTAIQAGADSGGVWTQVAPGEYTYRFGTKLPANYDRTATHSIGVYGNRNLTEFEMGTYLSDAVYNFVPDGSKVTVTRDVIKTATCNKCHNNLYLHGTSGRKSMEMCVLCHQPQTIDPDTGNSVDMPVMIHKIHAGEHLPSVAAGKPYVIIGYAQSVQDFSNVAFPSDVRSCRTCHESGKGAAQQDAWLKPNRAACGACHDDVNFATGEGHVNLPQVSDNQCATCHIPQGELEFDASIKGAHTIPRESAMLGGLQYELLKVENGSAGQKPTVTFSLKDKSGAPLAINQMQRLALVLSGPTTDYSAFTTGYVSEDISSGQGVQGANGVFTYTFNNAIPAGAKGSFTIHIEGRREVKVLEGTKKEQTIRYGAPNKAIHFSVDGSRLEPRRKVVDIAKCNACHTQLVLHGENRSAIEACVTCHNPIENDKSRRPAAEGAPETIDFRFMIHRIHGGEQVSEEYGTGIVIYGYGGSKNDFSEVRYPGGLNNCNMCHVNNSQNLPIKAVVPVQAPRQILTTMQPTAAACLACHQSRSAASHAVANTTAVGESCAVCHGATSDFSVGKAHAAPVQ
ncbi:MAG: OmcA/MtrC family decaheme c-type cytochrome [Acidobacteria bacterium]|nr:OmcA/MtrC family decaheme c-type cytochrome [Acidobacteriota bacterium]